jgi:hypothetical protein
MDGPRGCYKWNKPDIERQIPHGFTHMCYLMNKINKRETDP